MHSTLSVLAVVVFVFITAYWWGYAQGRHDAD